MKNYPIERYKVFTNDTDEVVCVSSFAGKNIRGVAKCSGDDTFDYEAGKKLAAMRCAAKVSKARAKRSEVKLKEAATALDAAQKYYDKMVNYFNESHKELAFVENEVNILTAEM